MKLTGTKTTVVAANFMIDARLLVVVAGGPASHLPQHELARMAARIPAARLVVVEGGHAVPAARPAEFAAAVRDFLAALRG